MEHTCAQLGNFRRQLVCYDPSSGEGKDDGNEEQSRRYRNGCREWYRQGDCQLIVESGHRCVLTGRRLNALEETAAMIADPDHTLLVQSDVTIAQDRKRVVSECLGNFGRLDILINNPGTASARRCLSRARNVA